MLATLVKVVGHQGHRSLVDPILPLVAKGGISEELGDDLLHVDEHLVQSLRRHLVGQLRHLVRRARRIHVVAVLVEA